MGKFTIKHTISEKEDIASSVKKIVGDGNCLFRAIAYCIYTNERFFYIVRKKVVEEIVKNWSEYCNFIIGGTYCIAINSVEDYRNHMMKNRVHGSFIEIAAATQVYNIRIHVFISGQSDVYEIGSENVCDNETVSSLLYNGDGDNGHYDVLILPTALPNSLGRLQVATDEIESMDVDMIVTDETNNVKKLKRVHNDSTSNKVRKTKKEITNKINDVGEMNVKCQYCGALYWSSESVMNNCCHNGKVKLPVLSPYPSDLQTLFHKSDFRTRIRNYNNMFAFAAFSANIISPNSCSVYVLKIQGQVHHVAPTSLYGQGNKRHGGQIYMYEPDDELEARKKLGCEGVLVEYIESISKTLHAVNPYVKYYKHLHQVHKESSNEEYALYFVRNPQLDQRRYNEPITAECAALIVSKDGQIPEFDLCTYPVEGDACKILNKLSCHIDPMVFPLLFPKGDCAWSPLMKQNDNCSERRISALQYYSYRLAIRNTNYFDPILYGGRLHQQYVIHAYIIIESTRLQFIRLNQKELRIECYDGLWDHVVGSALNNPDIYGDQVRLGNAFVLPSTYVGGPRYMQQLYQDAMAMVRKFGRPDLFITMTCNPKWPELVFEIKKLSTSEIKLKASDVPLLVVRIFHLKLKSLLKEIICGKIFGPILAYVYTVEHQKRGLPHVHLLITLVKKMRTAEQIDQCIKAEIPKADEDDMLRKLVIKHMLHGPHSSTSPCLNEEKVCTKKFPKPLVEETIMSENGFPTYKRRRMESTDNTYYNKRVDGKLVKVDNSMVVPYNPYLLKSYNCHINVEYCRSILSTKYIHKYIMKGHDRAEIQLKKKGSVPNDSEIYDEIGAYVDSRYLSPLEAAWRILELPLAKRSHTVVRLPVHCENQQRVVYVEGKEKCAIENPLSRKTALTSWFQLNKVDPSARKVLYRDIPELYILTKSKDWKKRKNKKQVIGRMSTVSPKDVERFHLKLILNKMAGATCFADLRTYEGVVYNTFKEAALRMGLIENENIIFEIFDEACQIMMPIQLREYFALFLCNDSEVCRDPLEIWRKYKNYFIDGFSDNEEYRALQHISNILQSENLSCSHFKLPEPDIDVHFVKVNDLIVNENHDGYIINPHEQEQHLQKGLQMKENLNNEQLIAFNIISESIVNNRSDRIFFLDGPGGTGKTYVYKALIHTLIGQGFCVLATAWTGIASILLPGGTTSHRAFNLPIDINNSNGCYVTEKKDKERLFKCNVIIWDEASMILGKAVDMVDNLLKDICNSQEPFAGKCVVFGGDFRQILPVIKFGNRYTVVEASIKRSSIWPLCKIIKLRTNMRSRDINHAKWLLDIGDGKIGIVNICTEWHSTDIVSDIYGEVINPNDDISQNTILTCHNDDVRALNNRILKKIQGESVVYHSIDHATSKGVDQTDENVELNYQIEYLNSIQLPGFPSSKVVLKVGAIVMLLRNLNIHAGLCNGTRLKITKLYKNNICGQIMTGERAGKEIFIPRIKLDTGETSNLPFILHRRQFPIMLAFAMTINKSQGQSFKNVGVYINRPLFSHGQLYVALSRCMSKDGIKIQNNNKKDNRCISNIVWQEIFD